ncbi:GNAT family N-acetyltransferase [Pararhodobacter sp.]|uniref:GNAT family N-acetyltransferase n=1 Tax=Pararhodobacter sp. TaxID=2127056 RepID=UPI002FDD6508
MVSDNTPRLRPLQRDDAARLAGLVSAYRAALGHGAAGVMSVPAAQALIGSAGAGTLLLGAETRAGLVGFAHAFDLPEILSGRRAGQLDDLFVAPEARGAGVARALIMALAGIGRERGWTHLRWLVPQDQPSARRLYEKIAAPAPWDSFVIDLATGPEAPPQARLI